jgi:hypothetical protein
MQHRQSKPRTFEERIAAEKAKIEAELARIDLQLHKLSPSQRRKRLDIASRWANSPGLQPPK